MHGSAIGSLRVFVVTEGSGYERLIWKMDGPQGDEWQVSKVGYSSSYVYRVS
jgi:MAM domain.